MYKTRSELSGLSESMFALATERREKSWKLNGDVVFNRCIIRSVIFHVVLPRVKERILRLCPVYSGLPLEIGLSGLHREPVNLKTVQGQIVKF